MPLKNYTTTISATKSISMVEEMLARHGAQSIIKDYETGTSRLSALSFYLNGVNYRLPLLWRETAEVLKRQGVRKRQTTEEQDEDAAYKISWKNLHDWVVANMVLVELAQVEMPQVFLPYAVMDNGETLYNRFTKSPALMLSSGSEN